MEWGRAFRTEGTECQGHEGESTAGAYEETRLERGEPGKSRGREVRGHGSGDAGCLEPCAYDDFAFKFKRNGKPLEGV